MIKELKDALQNDDRYENFTILEQPVKFNEFFKNKNLDCVQIHSSQIYQHENKNYIVGFCGAFSWINNILQPLDGDSYNVEMTIYGYEYFTNHEENVHSGVEVLVADDW